MGEHGIGTINDNGERLCHVCDENNMVIGGTLYQHRNMTTWTSPSGATKSQIDHILINGKWRRSLQDVRAERGADVASDHNLLVAVVSQKLRRARRGQQRGHQFDSSKLRDDRIRQAFKEAGEKVLGFKKRKREEWIQGETWEKIETRRRVKQRMNSTRSHRVRDQLRRKYSKLYHEVKKKDQTRQENLCRETGG